MRRLWWCRCRQPLPFRPATPPTLFSSRLSNDPPVTKVSWVADPLGTVERLGGGTHRTSMLPDSSAVNRLSALTYITAMVSVRPIALHRGGAVAQIDRVADRRAILVAKRHRRFGFAKAQVDLAGVADPL